MRELRRLFPAAIAVVASCSMVDGVVDRIEGEVAIVLTDEGQEVAIPAGTLREGDVLVGGRVDPEATRRRREAVKALIDARDEPPEDIEL